MDNELLLEFIERGGIITLYKSLSRDRYPIRFAAKWQGEELSGTVQSLELVLSDLVYGSAYQEGRMPIDGEEAREMFGA
jgi:hypothetical protein